MARVRHQIPGDQPEDVQGGSSDFRPYFFRRDATDVLREAFDELLSTRPERRAPARETTSEEAIIREQRKTLFEHDVSMRRLFNDDFDAFVAALDEPWRFDATIRQRPASPDARQSLSTTWDDLVAPARRWEERQQGAGHDHGAISLDDDSLYHHAFQWACRIERWGRRLRHGVQGARDADLVRALANITLVPAKIAFGFSASLDEDVAGLEVAGVGYRQAGVYLQRVLGSLGSCYGKRIGRPQTVHDFLDEGRELLSDIEMRIAEIESEIRFRRKSK